MHLDKFDDHSKITHRLVEGDGAMAEDECRVSEGETLLQGLHQAEPAAVQPAQRPTREHLSLTARPVRVLIFALCEHFVTT